MLVIAFFLKFVPLFIDLYKWIRMVTKRVRGNNRILIYDSEIGYVRCDWIVDDKKTDVLDWFYRVGACRSYYNSWYDYLIFKFLRNAIVEGEHIEMDKIEIGGNDRNIKLVFGNRTIVYRRGSGRIETITDFKKEFFHGLYKFFNHRDSEAFFSFFTKGIREGEKIEKSL